jgi:hypothetical protein
MPKTYRIIPDVRILLPWILLSLVMGVIAVLYQHVLTWISFGFSLLFLWIFYRYLHQEDYTLGDHSIQVETKKNDQTIALHDIVRVRVIKVWWLSIFDLGHVELETSNLLLRLRGVKDPAGIGAIIQKAVDLAIERHNRQGISFQAPTQMHPAGTLEQLNDLVGLWQQGIIDDATFEEEQKRLQKDLS